MDTSPFFLCDHASMIILPLSTIQQFPLSVRKKKTISFIILGWFVDHFFSHYCAGELG
jgi:hypothetical protein